MASIITKTGTSRADKLTAAAAYTSLYCGKGNDTLSSASFVGVSLYGNDGDDILIAKATDVLIDGGAGKDTVQFAGAVGLGVLSDDALVNVERIVITNTGDAVYDFSIQGVGDDSVAGGLETLNISGGAGRDTIYGGHDADTLSGGTGNDLLIAQDTDALIDGGAGIDTVRFAGAVSAANLTDKDLVGVEKVEITDSVAAVYDFSAQSEGLIIMGADADDTIIGGKGADTVQFDADVDALVLTDLELKNVESVVIDNDGGISLDLSLQTESLKITGDVGDDMILGGYLADTITGGAGADALYGNDGADLFVADASDLIDGGLGDDTVRYATGFGAFADDNLVNVERVVIANSGNAAYYFSAQSEKLNISGGVGSDTLHGGAGADTLSGGAGNDLIIAVDTDGLIDGGAGTDTVRFAAAVSAANLADQDLVAIEKVEIAGTGATAYDFSAQSEGLNITGSAYVDSVTGGKGADSISGGVGADSLDGGAGNDTLFGGVGDDTLVGGTGADILRGGDNSDVLVAEDTDALIDGGSNAATGVYAEFDTVEFAKSVTAKNLLDADMVGIEKVKITNVSTHAIYDFSAQTEALFITGNDRNDVIIGSQDWDSITGGAGNDTLRGGKGRDDFLADAGNDTIADLEVRERLGIAAGATATATGVLDYRLIDVWGDGVLNIVGTPKVDAIWGSNIRDSITARDGSDIIDAREGDDTVVASTGSDVITLGSGNDVAQFGTDGSLVAAYDTLTDYAIMGDVLDFGVDVTLLAAGGTAVAGSSVETSAKGNVTFAAADDTVIEKIAALQADSRLDAAGKVAIFQNTDATKGAVGSYVYYSGAAGGNADDQIVFIKGLDALDAITITAGDIKLDKNPTYDWPINSRSILSTPEATGGASTSSSDGYRLSSTASRTLIDADPTTIGVQFGTAHGSGDDYYKSVDISTVFSNGLNFFNNSSTPYYTTAYIGSNGYVTFARGYSGFSSSGIAGFTYAPMIAGQFDDLYASAGRNVAAGDGFDGVSTGTGTFYSYADVTNHRVVFTWDNIGLFSSGSGSSSSGSDGAGSAFQIILNQLDADSNTGGFQTGSSSFGIEIRYEDVRLNFANATAGWTAGDKFNYSTVDSDNNSATTYSLNKAVSDSNIGIAGVWAWNVIDGMVEKKTWLPNIDPPSGVDLSSATEVMYLDVQSGGPLAAPYTARLVNDDGGRFTVVPVVSDADTFVLKTVSGARWNLWKEAYRDGMTTVSVEVTGSPTGSYAPKSFDIYLYDSGLDTVSRDTAGTGLVVTATSSDLNSALDTELTTVTSVSSGAAVSGINVDLHLQSEGFTITGSGQDDTISGGSGVDTLDAGAGDDTYAYLTSASFVMAGAVKDGINDASGAADKVVVTGAIAITASDSLARAEGVEQLLAAVVADDGNAGTGGLAHSIVIDSNAELNDIRTIDLSASADAQSTGVINLAGVTSAVTTTLKGVSAGQNTITGGAGIDNITGGSGSDTLTGGAGVDSLSGGSGNDLLIVASATDGAVGETYDGGDGTDRLRVTGTTLLDLTDDFLTSIEALDLTKTAATDDQVVLLNADQVDALSTMDASGGDRIELQDVMTSGLLDGTVINGTLTLKLKDLAGNALTLVEAVMDASGDQLVVDGSALTGTNALTFVGTAETTAKVSVTGGSANDVLTGTDGADTLAGGGGEDTITGGVGADNLNGGDGDDKFEFENYLVLDGDATVIGGIGTDTIAFTTAFNGLSDNFHAKFSKVVDVEHIQLFGASTVNISHSLMSKGLSTILTGNDSTTLRMDEWTSGTYVVDATLLADGKSLTIYQFGSPAAGNWFDVTNLRGDLNANGINGHIKVTAASGAGFAVSITGGSGNDTITGSAGVDTIRGGNGNDIITGGAGADSITGGSGANRFVFAAGDNGAAPSENIFDIITDWTTGVGNTIDFGATAILQVSPASDSTAGAGMAGVTTTGVVTFDGADDTLAERITAVESAINASGTELAGQALTFQYGSDSYVFVSDGTDGVGANDVLIKLVGVSGTSYDTLMTSAGDITGLT